MTHHVDRTLPKDRSAFAGYRFPPELIMLAVRWYLRYGLSYRDVEELLVERGIGFRWFVDETYVKVAGKWRYVYRAVNEHGQVIDVVVSPRRNIASAKSFLAQALDAHGEPNEVVTDLA
ncbi:MAG: IS6 family transposase [Acidimicrobiales bacterium]|jgi:IS6 family transposase